MSINWDKVTCEYRPRLGDPDCPVRQVAQMMPLVGGKTVYTFGAPPADNDVVFTMIDDHDAGDADQPTG